VGEDLLERGAILGHGLGTGLTESHAVSLANTGEDEGVAVFCFGEVVTGDGSPSKTANDVDSSAFIEGVDVGDCRGGDTGGPANRVSTAMWTFDGVIRVVGGRKVKLGRGVRASAATAGVHGGERLGIVSEDEAVRGGDGVRGRTRGWRRFAQELAVRGVAEIELVVPGASGHEVRADRYGFGLEGFEGSIASGFGGQHGGDGGFAIHSDDGEQTPGGWPDFERAAIVACELLRDGEKERRRIGVAAGDRDLGDVDGSWADDEGNGVIIEAESCGVRARTGLKDKLLRSGVQDEGVAGKSGDGELLEMEQAQDTDADG